ncbi:MAG: hypothetical protein ACI9U2_003223 [Bradymonadia bacterium]|jgi:hypothetical protein
MTWLFEDEMRQGLRRLAFGLQVRIVLVAVGMPLWVWAVQARHPTQAWAEGAFWLVCPLTDLIMAWGASRLGARAGSIALLAAGMINLYAAVIGFSGSELGRGQIPFAMSLAEVVAFIGTFSALAYVRGPVEDAKRAALARRIYRAMAVLVVSISCVLIVRSVMWQGLFEGLAALIVAGAVVALVIMGLLEVVGVLRAAEMAEGQREHDRKDDRPASPVDRPRDDRPRDDRPRDSRDRRASKPRRAVGGYHADRFGPPTTPPDDRLGDEQFADERPASARSAGDLEDDPERRRRPQIFDDEDAP